MTQIFTIGVMTVIIGVCLLAVGGGGHSPVEFSYGEGSMLGQAWFIMLLIGLLLMVLDTYLTAVR